MRSSTVILLPLLASLTTAQPHKQHRHQHAKRNDDPAVEWVTEYEYTTEVVPVTETIWVSAGSVPPETTSTTVSIAQNTVPAQFFEPVSKQSSSAASTFVTSTTPVAVTQAVVTTEAPVVPAPSPSPSAAAPSVEEKPAEAKPVESPVVVASSVEPVVSSTSVLSAPEASTPSPSAAPASGSTGGPCSSGSACQGDITHYDANVGLGACGWQSDGTSENVVALSHLLMGTQSNGNPYCGQSITVKLNGKSITAKVVDKCMGCAIHAIDLSEHAFSQLEDMGVGRTQVEWYFN